MNTWVLVFVHNSFVVQVVSPQQLCLANHAVVTTAPLRDPRNESWDGVAAPVVGRTLLGVLWVFVSWATCETCAKRGGGSTSPR